MTNHQVHPPQESSSTPIAEADSADPDSGPVDGMYRREAVDDHTALERRGELLNLSDRWSRWTPCVVLAVVGSAAAFLSLVQASEFATGPARVVATTRGLCVVASIPAIYRVRAHPGTRLLFHYGSPSRTLELPVTAVTEPVPTLQPDAGAMEERSGLEVTAECLPADCSAFEQLSNAGTVGASSIIVGSTPLMFAMFPRLRGLVRHGSP